VVSVQREAGRCWPDALALRTCAAPATVGEWNAAAFRLFPMATGAARWEGRQEDDSPSPDTGQHGLPAFCAGMFAQCRRVGWRGRIQVCFP
jgi:hypothetical protein